eukprot:JZ551205.1.p5 GENE.JZ551205.1~~JZ551205.1.p5  ORF type:complete len:89 (-),score=6.51 JZ551205.1:47-313(-)
MLVLLPVAAAALFAVILRPLRALSVLMFPDAVFFSLVGFMRISCDSRGDSTGGGRARAWDGDRNDTGTLSRGGAVANICRFLCHEVTL